MHLTEHPLIKYVFLYKDRRVIIVWGDDLDVYQDCIKVIRVCEQGTESHGHCVTILPTKGLLHSIGISPNLPEDTLEDHRQLAQKIIHDWQNIGPDEATGLT